MTIQRIMDIDSWLKSNRLRLTPAKTEYIWLATPRRFQYFNDSSFILGNTAVKPINFGVVMNQDFSIIFYVNKLV